MVTTPLDPPKDLGDSPGLRPDSRGWQSDLRKKDGTKTPKLSVSVIQEKPDGCSRVSQSLTTTEEKKKELSKED